MPRGIGVCRPDPVPARAGGSCRLPGLWCLVCPKIQGDQQERAMETPSSSLRAAEGQLQGEDLGSK